MITFNEEEFKKKIEQEHSFPSLYMFKFILLADNHKLALLESFFLEDAELFIKPSDKGKYISLTAKQVVLSSDEVIAIYKKAYEIEGVMAL